MIFINFKSYQESTGTRAIRLINYLLEAQKETDVAIIPVVHDFDVRPAVEIWKTKENNYRQLWIQHADNVDGTGNNPVEMFERFKEDKEEEEWLIDGTFLNHSEHRFSDYNTLRKVVEDCFMSALKCIVFATDIPGIKEIIRGVKLPIGPTYIAYEPPELIASPTTSVARAKPEIISTAAEIAKDAGIPLVVGAGVKDMEDVRKVVELGAVGVAVSSAVVLAGDPKSVILDLAKGFAK